MQSLSVHSRPLRRTAGCAIAFALFLTGATPVAAQDRDHYLESTPLNSQGTVLPGNTGADSDNTGATQRPDDLFLPIDSGGPPENLGCVRNSNTVYYGATEWFDIYPHRSGVVSIFVDGNGFTPMAAIMPFNPANAQPDYNGLSCLSAGGLGALEFTQAVTEGVAYSIQVGGVNQTPSDPNTTPGQGPYTLAIAFDPDTDRDGLRDSADRCDTVRGPASNGGCPPAPAARPDPDRDGVFNDGPDKCPIENARGRDANGDGCLDPRRLDRLVKEEFGGLFGGGRYRISKFSLSGVPAGARISAKCVGPRRRGKRRSCGKQTISKATLSGPPKAQAAKTRKLRRFIGKRLRPGSVITVRVTARKSIGKYIKITIVRRGRALTTKRSFGCLDQGARVKVKRKGCR